MSDHFNTAEGFPQSRDEVHAASDAMLQDFMGMCPVEPADYDDCLACYACRTIWERWKLVADDGPQPGPEPAQAERLTQVQQRLAEVLSQLAQASTWLENWPAEDEAGAQFSDNARLLIDGVHQTLEGFTELLGERRAAG